LPNPQTTPLPKVLQVLTLSYTKNTQTTGKLRETSNRHHRNRLDWQRDMESQIKKGM